jgi:cysteine desulfurase/selenocysteine lyase
MQTSCPTVDLEALFKSASLDCEKLKKSFPIFQKHPNLIYFDNASTTQKPRSVIEEIDEYYKSQCANAGRAAYPWSTQLALRLQEVRSKLAQFIKGRASNLAFTGGATDSLNTVALAFGLTNLEEQDEILLCLEDHKSAVLPWYNLQALLKTLGKEINIKHFTIHEVGDYNLKSIREALTTKTRVIALSHIHHVYGLDMEIAEIREIVGPEVYISLDSSQAIGHKTIEADNLPVDFISFSGHKMFAAPGVGGLYVSDRVKNKMHPLRLGGGSNAQLEKAGLVLSESPNFCERIEAGTPNIPAILSLGAAIDFIEEWGQEKIESHVSNLTIYLWQKLAALKGLRFAPGIGICGCLKGYGILAFNFENIATSDLAFALAQEEIFLRSGDHCAYLKKGEQPELDDYLRVSLHAYNSFDEIDQFIVVLEALLEA